MKPDAPTTYDRIVAGTCSIAAFVVVLGAKAAVVTLIILALVFLPILGTSWTAKPPRFALHLPRPSPALGSLFAFCALAGLSATWAAKPAVAISAAATLFGAIALATQLELGLTKFSKPASTLLAGWFTIGLALGCVYLAIELFFGFPILRAVLGNFAFLQPENNLMKAETDGRLRMDPAIANWSIGSTLLLLWPAFLILASLTRRSAQGWLPIVFFATVSVIVFRSEHDTSKIAIVASAFVFLIARALPIATVKRLLLLLSLAGTIAVVPVSLVLHDSGHVEQMQWVPQSMKERIVIWANVAQHVLDAPVFGIGANNTSAMHTNGTTFTDQQDGRQRHHSHNMLLQIWLELGAVGALFLSAIVVAALRQASETGTELAPFVFAMYTATCVEALATWNFWSSWFQFCVALSFFVLVLGLRIARFSRENDFVAFRTIWLP